MHRGKWAQWRTSQGGEQASMWMGQGVNQPGGEQAREQIIQGWTGKEAKEPDIHNVSLAAVMSQSVNAYKGRQCHLQIIG